MKYLYLWNDMPIFDKINVIEIDRKIQNFFALIQSSKCKYIFINSPEYNQWTDQLKGKSFNNVITIGTRPSLLQLPNATNTKSIKIRRHFTSNGFTKSLEFSNKADQSIIEIWSHTYNELHFIEDVVVTGSTLQFICKILELYHFQGRVIFHIFCANHDSVKKLKTNINYEIIINSKINLEKEAIKESTLLCLYDLLFSKYGNKLYRERVDLLELFFFDKVSQLLELLAEIEIIIKFERKSNMEDESYGFT
jgi:hypothetical protein